MLHHELEGENIINMVEWFEWKYCQESSGLLDKDWGAKIPDYITKGTFSLAVFFMSLTMRGDWIMFLAHYWRSQETNNLAGNVSILLEWRLWRLSMNGILADRMCDCWRLSC